MKASIIIPTYNGARKISNLLDGLVKQTVKDFEVLIVIDGSTDSTYEVVEPYKKAFPNFKTLTQKNRGRSSTRNVGASQAQGEILIFYDDDMLPYPDSIARHLNFHEKNAECLLGGNQFEIDSKSNSDIQNYKAYISAKWLTKHTDGISLMNSQNLFFTSANCSMPTKVFNRLRGFDERLNDVEDWDLAFRALNENIKVYFDKGNKAIHHDSITCMGYITRLRQYAEAKQQWNKIHSNEAPKTTRSSIKGFFYLPLASHYWMKAIDKNLFIYFPMKIRYKLYDLVIQALAIEFPKTKLE